LLTQFAQDPAASKKVNEIVTNKLTNAKFKVNNV